VRRLYELEGAPPASVAWPGSVPGVPRIKDAGALDVIAPSTHQQPPQQQALQPQQLQGQHQMNGSLSQGKT